MAQKTTVNMELDYIKEIEDGQTQSWVEYCFHQAVLKNNLSKKKIQELALIADKKISEIQEGEKWRKFRNGELGFV